MLTQADSCLALLTIYGVFALSGIVDILAFYTATATLLPKQVRLVIDFAGENYCACPSC